MPPSPVLMDDLPDGWIETELIELAAEGKYPIGDGDHGQIKPACYSKKGIPYIRVADLSWGKFKPNGLVFIPKEVHEQNLKSQLFPGDIVIAKTGATIGKCCIIPDDMKTANTTSSVGKVSVNTEATSSKYILYYFLSREFKDQMWAVSEKTAQPGFNIDDLKKFIIPLPPLPEQNRIVAKLDRILSRVEACKSRIENIPLAIKKFRQSILISACSGKLLLNRKSEIDSDDLPVGWVCIPLGKLLKTDPQNGIYKPQSEYGRGTPILRIDNFYDGIIEPWVNLKKVNLTGIEKNKYKLSDRDILVNRVNSMKFLGKVALVRNLPELCVFESNMMKLQFDVKKSIPEYVTFFLSSLIGREELHKNAKHAVNQSSINQDDVRAVMINLPPLEEQLEIVRRVKTLFALADRLEAQYLKAKKKVEKLTQSVLAKAFRGELVPQDSSDEPASVLLERIRAKKDAISHLAKKPKKKVLV